MKRALWVILALAVLLTGCSLFVGMETPQTMEFYYCQPQNQNTQSLDYGSITGTLATEDYVPKTDASMEQIVADYLDGPRTEDLWAPYPAGLQVVSCSLEQGILTLIFNETWNQCTGLQKTMAQACLVSTMTQLPQVNQLRLATETDADIETLVPSDYLVFDDFATNDWVTISVYFGGSDGRYLVRETRSCDLPEEALPAYVLRQLFSGPQSAEAKAVLPAGTTLLQVQVNQGVCTINLSEQFVSKAPEDHLQARLIVFSVVNTLTELPQVECVRFLCSGRTLGDYGGLDLSEALFREEAALDQEDGGLLLDTTLYLPCHTDGMLAPVPTQIRQTTGRMGEDSIINALLNFQPANGYTNPFPEDLMIADATVQDGLCRIVVNNALSQLNSHPEQAQLAVRSLVASLCSMESVNQVQIQIKDGTMTAVDLSQPMAADPTWMVE